MYSTHLKRIARTAENACALVVNQPTDIQAREALLDALASVVDPAFQGDDPEFDHLKDLFGEARVWADIVRCRIENSRNSIVSAPVAAIQHPARDLQQLLVRLVDELNGPASADS
jgi:hypothetical protein